MANNNNRRVVACIAPAEQAGGGKRWIPMPGWHPAGWGVMVRVASSAGVVFGGLREVTELTPSIGRPCRAHREEGLNNNFMKL